MKTETEHSKTIENVNDTFEKVSKTPKPQQYNQVNNQNNNVNLSVNLNITIQGENKIKSHRSDASKNSNTQNKCKFFFLS